MKIALLQNNTTIGDLYGNAEKITQGVKSSNTLGAELIITPELALLGYPPRDLLLQPAFIHEAWKVLEHLATKLLGMPPVLVGIAEATANSEGRPLYNSAVLLHDGKIKTHYYKNLLPSYDVFDEDRYFEPASTIGLLDLHDKHIGITICEDIWNDKDFWQRKRYHTDPVENLAKAGADFVLNLSASPFAIGKQQLREKMLGSMALKHQLPIIYINQVGGNDDLVFDGRSCAFNAEGKLVARAKPFLEDLLMVDSDPFTGAIAADDFLPEAEIWRALVTGTRDYAHKCGFMHVLLGLSGGIDSSLTAAIACEAVGSENVLGVMMPSPFSSSGSIEDSRELVNNLNIKSITLPISSIMQAYDDVLRTSFEGTKKDITEENIQARIRGNLLMSLSNKFGALLLTTGNKSEMAVGYCTLYGDMSGGLAVIADVPKTMVYRLVKWLNAQRERPVIPNNIVIKAPSAELRPNQTDQDSLPPYDILDAILEQHIEHHQSAVEITQQGYEETTVRHVLDLVYMAEFKRKQAAPGIKVTDRAFGTGWRFPIARKDWEKGIISHQT